MSGFYQINIASLCLTASMSTEICIIGKILRSVPDQSWESYVNHAVLMLTSFHLHKKNSDQPQPRFQSKPGH